MASPPAEPPPDLGGPSQPFPPAGDGPVPPSSTLSDENNINMSLNGSVSDSLSSSHVGSGMNPIAASEKPASLTNIKSVTIHEDLSEERKELSVFVGTFNANAKKPKSVDAVRDWLNEGDFEPDVYAIGLQEIIKLHILNAVGPEHGSRQWERMISSAIGSKYVLVSSKQMIGILLVIFIKRELFPFVRAITFDKVAVGIGGVVGNKGAVVTRFNLFDTTFYFLTSHLAARKEKKRVHRRNQNVATIIHNIRLEDRSKKSKYVD